MNRASLLPAVATVLVIFAGCGSGGGNDASPRLVSPAVFGARVETDRVVTINVHTPDEGSIPGTDLAIPFDRIATSNELPADLNTPLAIYCRSGNMSADAVEDLERLGYTDIVELDGGFNTWQASGRELEPVR